MINIEKKNTSFSNSFESMWAIFLWNEQFLVKQKFVN